MFTAFSRTIIPLCLVWLLSGCASSQRVSYDPDYNYSMVFSGMRQPKPLISYSRLERYSERSVLGKVTERTGEWEFEFLASRDWVNEVGSRFIPLTFTDSFHSFRRPTPAWWKPTEEAFHGYHMPYSSYSSAHLYVEKNPVDKNLIRVFIQRH